MMNMSSERVESSLLNDGSSVDFAYVVSYKGEGLVPEV